MADRTVGGVHPGDARRLDDLLTLLVRALQQVQTYPASSPICHAAIEAVKAALCGPAIPDEVSFRVTPSDLVFDEAPQGAGTSAARELAARLHRAGVATVTIDRGASVREIARFCEDVVRCSSRRGTEISLLDMLAEHGVERIGIEMAHHPEILDVGGIPESTAQTLARERARTEALFARGGAVHHLYPPQKGWVRLDPAAGPQSISLVDLTVLTEDPAELASMLLRLTGDEAGSTPGNALGAKYSDVAMLIASLEPPVARRLFSKLARAVLDLDTPCRQALLRRTVLPGLLDGRIDGAILHDFPDVDLAESLCLLLDIETAAPELLSTALARLDLSAERHAAVAPLLDARLREREESLESDRHTALVKHARELVRLDPAEARSFAEFSAFDLSLDAAARATLVEIREAVPAGDVLSAQLACLSHLLSLEPNPESVCRFLDRSFALLATLEQASRGHEVPAWVAGYRAVSDGLRESRPDVSEAITVKLAGFCTPERTSWLVELASDDPEHPAAAGIIAALGPSIAPAFVRLIERAAVKDASRRAQERGRTAARLLAQYARAVAPGIPPLLDGAAPPVRRTLLRVLGAAGPGYEDAVAPHAADVDEVTAREALRALARIGSPKAAALVVAQITKQDGPLSVAAEETLWHFPAAEAERRTRDLLARREFTLTHPHAAERLLDRVARARREGLDEVLQGLAALRFRLWNPAVARVARKAHRLLQTET